MNDEEEVIWTYFKVRYHKVLMTEQKRITTTTVMIARLRWGFKQEAVDVELN
jgi:hypothetical protein